MNYTPKGEPRLRAAMQAADVLFNQVQWPPRDQDDEDARNFTRCMRTAIELYRAYARAGGPRDVEPCIDQCRAALRGMR